jgi:hypothetical protein
MYDAEHTLERRFRRLVVADDVHVANTPTSDESRALSSPKVSAMAT